MEIYKKMNDLINIGGSPDDPHYRYKRNKIEIIHINKNEGMTKITNMTLIKKQLKMPDPFITAFYKRIQKKKGLMMVSEGVFRGTVNVSVFEIILEEMIKKYVLCPKCRLPEWDQNNCKACGYSKNIGDQPRITAEDVKHANGCESENDVVRLACLLYETRSKETVNSEKFEKINKLLDLFWELKSGVDENKWKKRAQQLVN